MNFITELEKVIPSTRVKARLIDVLSYASDAGFYHLVPKAVVLPIGIKEIQALFYFSKKTSTPLVFRAGGTSLSGQSITDGILVDLSRHWQSVSVEEKGDAIRVQPGLIGAMANAHLKKYKRKIGPDPSSISAAMMGGIISNNSSGMCCGVKHNSYHTVKALTFVLPDGKIYSTEKVDDYERFNTDSSAIANKLVEIRKSILANENLLKKIRAKYLTKNTVGYSLNAFVDYERPLDILAHLMVGGEGTLGFIAEAVMQTVPDYPCKATALLVFPDLHQACAAIIPLKNSGAEALELMDRASLRSIESMKGAPSFLKTLPSSAAALLCEYQTNTVDELSMIIEVAKKLLTNFVLLENPEFTTDTEVQALLWKLRKGMFPSVGAMRQQGTTVVLEDIAFPLERLAEGIADTQALFIKYGYENGIIFGHAKDGNIHFVITQSFNTAEETKRYEGFMSELVELVVKKYDGALKAEHGTGRNMAPFIETEWGGDAYAIMKELKLCLDPELLLNPGVIINDDKHAHIKNLKQLPQVEFEVDKCIECGFCEHSCPSRNLTLTPRKRIVVRRELQKLKLSLDSKKYKTLLQEYQYEGLDTCAVDGLCATDCPVNINTGDLVKRLRKENHSSFSNAVAKIMAIHFSTVEFCIRLGLRIAKGVNGIFGKNTVRNSTLFFRKIIPSLPLWSNQLHPASKIKNSKPAISDVVYFTTCITRCMGGSKEKAPLAEVFLKLSKKAGINVHIPENISGHCCGQPFSSKGYQAAAAEMANKTIVSLWSWTENGRIPVIVDGSSCTYTFLNVGPLLSEENRLLFEKIKFVDIAEYMADYLLPKIKIIKPKASVVLHPVCSLTKMGITGKLDRVARACSEKVEVPLHAGCCGMAGDRGFLFPELTASAILLEKEEVLSKKSDGYYSCGKTCEMAMTENVGKEYESILYLLDEVS